jgi:hypothetical protein
MVDDLGGTNTEKMDNNNSRWSKTAIIAFIVSIIGLIWGLGLSSFGIIPILGIILGIIGIRKIKRNNGKIKGKGLALSSIILGFAGLILPLWILTSVIWTMIIRS